MGHIENLKKNMGKKIVTRALAFSTCVTLSVSSLGIGWYSSSSKAFAAIKSPYTTNRKAAEQLSDDSGSNVMTFENQTSENVEFDKAEEKWDDGKVLQISFTGDNKEIAVGSELSFTMTIDKAAYDTLKAETNLIKIEANFFQAENNWKEEGENCLIKLGWPQFKQSDFKEDSDGNYNTDVSLPFDEKSVKVFHSLLIRGAGIGFSGTVQFSNIKLTRPSSAEQPSGTGENIELEDKTSDSVTFGNKEDWNNTLSVKYDGTKNKIDKGSELSFKMVINEAAYKSMGENDYIKLEADFFQEADNWDTLVKAGWPEYKAANFKAVGNGTYSAEVQMTLEESVNTFYSLVIRGVGTGFTGTVTFSNVKITKSSDEDKYVKIEKKVKSEIDTADLSKMATSVKLVDAKAIDSTKALAAYFMGLQKSGQVIFGHQNSTFKSVCDDGKTSDVYDVTGSEAGLFGIDTLALTGGESGQDTLAGALKVCLEAAKKAYDAGSLISLSCHMPNFTNDKIIKTNDEKYPYDFTKCDFNESKDLTPCIDYILEGGEYNPQFNAYLDIIADFAKALQEKGIPVLLRPFHENNGGWFWWGSATSIESYKAAWRYMVNYFEDNGVHNFIYIYSPNGPINSEEEYLERYPGDAYVDILAFDFYDDYNDANNYKEYNPAFFDALNQTCTVVASLAEKKNKIPAIAETGVRIVGAGRDSLMVSENPIKDKDWYNNVVNTAAKCNIPYFLLWANFNEDNFFVPYKYNDTLGQELINEFIDFYNNEKSIFANGTNFYGKDGAVGKADSVTLTGYSDSEVNGYMISPKNYAVIKEACDLKAYVKNGQKVEFQIKTSDNSEVVTIAATKDSDKSMLYTGKLSKEILDLLGETSTGIITLIADETELGKAKFINFNKDADVLSKGMFDNFEYYYGDNSLLQSKYSPHNSASGCSSSISLYDIEKAEGDYSGAFDYTLDYKGSEVWTGGIGRTFDDDKTDLSEYNAISMWVKPDGNGQKMVFQLNSEYEVYLTDFVKGTKAQYVTIPFSSFKKKGGTETIDPSNITGFMFWCNSMPKDEDGNYKVSGKILFDDIHAVKISDEDLAKVDSNGLIISDKALEDLLKPVVTPTPESPTPQPSAPTQKPSSGVVLNPGGVSSTSSAPSGTSAAPSSAPTSSSSATSVPTDAPKASQTPSNEITGAVKETTTTVDGNKTTVTEKVTMPDGTQNIKVTVTEVSDGITKVTETLSSSTVNAIMVTNVTYDSKGRVISSDAAIYTGISDINSSFSAKIKIPESYLLSAKDANIDNVAIYIEKPTVDTVKGNQGRKMVIKIEAPAVDGVSIGKVMVTKDSILSATEGTKKLVVKIVNANPSKSYTVTIPQSELKKMSEAIDITVKALSSSQQKVNSILSSNGVKASSAYVVSMPINNTKGGIKVTTPVLSSSAEVGSSVYVYRYNSKSGKLEEIANSKRTVLKDKTASIEGYSGNDYVVTNKSIDGKNVTTLLDKSKVSVNKATVKKGNKTSIKVSLPLDLVVKTGLKQSVPYGKQAAVVTYKSSDKKIAKVSKDGTVKAKGKGTATISVKIKLADGKVKTVKKNVVVK